MSADTVRSLNYGCGRDYRPGWVNAEINRAVKADVYIDPARSRLPFEDDTFEEVLLDNVLEHLPREQLFPFLDEMYRICRQGALLRVYVPHYTSVFNHANLSHCASFAIGAFDCCAPSGMFNSGERYGKAAFLVKKQRLLFFGHRPVRFPLLARLPINWMFNFGWAWQKLMERFQFAGFDEVYFELEVVKPAPPAA
jgi:SAM-dependent methyltransferase